MECWSDGVMENWSVGMMVMVNWIRKTSLQISSSPVLQFSSTPALQFSIMSVFSPEIAANRETVALRWRRTK